MLLRRFVLKQLRPAPCKSTSGNFVMAKFSIAPPQSPKGTGAGEGAVTKNPLSQTNVCSSSSIHKHAYLSIGVTSGTGAVPSGVPGVGDFGCVGPRICTILQANFREFIFHALR